MNLQGIKLLLVEDSSVLASSIAELISQMPEIDFTDVADSEAAALKVLRRGDVHIVVLDLHLRQGSGFAVLRALSTLHHRPQVIVLTNHGAAEYEQQALRMGATMFLDKARDFPRLGQILAEVVGQISCRAGVGNCQFAKRANPADKR